MPSKEDAMNNQKNDSMDRRKLVRRNSQSSVSTYVRETLHIDLIIEIVSRLPLDSIAICRCVSKQWASILQRPDFAESFLTKSLSRPRLLFTFRSGSKCAELWVLDDTKNVKWSKYKFVLPYTASEEVKKSIWATDSGELVWTLSSPLSHPLYVYYYNLESQSVREVEIKGMKDKVSRDIGNSLVTFTNYVENLMFLQ
ncbi:unnamed protein product [Arabidopsis thaliana]|uniref:(thale cress) hypothetical protein n=1 Tax=Arabidopsis thaliana TaxID=3702 RepID=A0A7G2DYQ9_ARATH|nr:unnamed protein product [Arabidopsis thaliana]